MTSPGAKSSFNDDYDYIGSVQSIIDECESQKSDPHVFPARELEETQNELQDKIRATDDLMNKIEMSINLDQHLQLKDSFTMLQLDARIDKVTLANEQRFHLTRR